MSMDLIAHRGFAATGPENAASTLTRAAERADAVEFDVRLSSDGVPVVFHDRRVDRLTDATGPVAGFSAAALTSMRLADGDETVPTLETVLDCLAGPIVLDLKTDHVPERVVDGLRDYGGPALVSSGRPDVLRALPADVDAAVLCGPAAAADDRPDGALADLPAAIEVGGEVEAAAVHPHHSHCSISAVEAAHGAGFAVNAWTIDSRAGARAMAAAGVDGVIADDPAVLDGDDPSATDAA